MLQEYIEGLDVLARTIIQQTNNVYAKSADNLMISDNIGKTVQLTATQKTAQLKPLLEDMGKKVQTGDIVFSIYDLSGKIIQKDIKVEINPTSDSLKDVVDAINDKFKEEDIDAQATIELGVLKVGVGGSNGSTKVSSVLIKEDNSLITSALNMTGDLPLSKVDAVDIPFDITNGSFDIGLYDTTGSLISTRTITIDKDSTDPLFSTINGIISQINMRFGDDNDDNDFTNDVDDYIVASFSSNRFTMRTKNEDIGAYFNIMDNGTGFAGALGLHKFFDGNSASNIKINKKFEDNPPDINAYGAPVEGNNEVANDMQQLQYDDVPFFYPDGKTNYDTIIGGYRYYAGKLAETVHSIDTAVDTFKAVYTSVKEQQDSISRVSVDEELTNLLRFQNAYGANAKVITTIQQMLDTLLTLKT
jgi:flagellar hook-associated protein 1 FlgK